MRMIFVADDGEELNQLLELEDYDLTDESQREDILNEIASAQREGREYELVRDNVEEAQTVGDTL